MTNVYEQFAMLTFSGLFSSRLSWAGSCVRLMFAICCNISVASSSLSSAISQRADSSISLIKHTKTQQ